jgi:hypothetical protein
MVTVDQVHETLRKLFSGIHEQEVHDDLTVSIRCKVLQCKRTKLNQLPVTFRHIEGDVRLKSLGLTTLKGLPDIIHGNLNVSSNRLDTLAHAPQRVEGDFVCSNNPITTLVHGPAHVIGAYMANDCALTELTGMASHMGYLVDVDYNGHMGLLRCLVAPIIYVEGAPTQVKDILNKYVGEGKPGAIKAAVELIKAGFKDNARW